MLFWRSKKVITEYLVITCNWSRIDSKDINKCRMLLLMNNSLYFQCPNGFKQTDGRLALYFAISLVTWCYWNASYLTYQRLHSPHCLSHPHYYYYYYTNICPLHLISVWKLFRQFQRKGCWCRWEFWNMLAQGWHDCQKFIVTHECKGCIFDNIHFGKKFSL